MKAASVMKRAESLFFYPYYNGSRYPNYSNNTKQKRRVGEKYADNQTDTGSGIKCDVFF